MDFTAYREKINTRFDTCNIERATWDIAPDVARVPVQISPDQEEGE